MLHSDTFVHAPFRQRIASHVPDRARIAALRFTNFFRAHKDTETLSLLYESRANAYSSKGIHEAAAKFLIKASRTATCKSVKNSLSRRVAEQYRLRAEEFFDLAIENWTAARAAYDEGEKEVALERLKMAKVCFHTAADFHQKARHHLSFLDRGRYSSEVDNELYAVKFCNEAGNEILADMFDVRHGSWERGTGAPSKGQY